MAEEQRPWKVATRPTGVEPVAVVRVFRVPPEAAGTRVDVFLSSQLRNTSRTRAKLIADHSAYTIDGRKLSPSDRVRGEDHVAIWRLPPDEADKPAELPVLFQDEHVMAIDKPPMLAVHPTARHHNATVIKLLEARSPGQFFSLIHRIDRETSGILLCGLSRASDRAFKRLIEDRSIANSRGLERDAELPVIRKTYLAITWGVPESGLIDLPLIRDPENSLRVKMRVVEGGLESRTDVTVIGVRGKYALVRCDLLTGRQHQIRIHLASVGCPIVGDKLYGPDERMLARAADRELTEDDHAKLELPRHALHAHRYRLPHAMTGEELDVTSPLPPDLQAFWSSRPET
ncbi:MAG TPA: RluA family pseudouridine synthase [Polyangiaceae bacterium]|jgi:23S rRNA pseudouridine1911/1915/1917 synthase|nr:RluA family pseudouridine synthase [Polyangiaceae bacterium]